jgi:Arm DNA-binding domain
MGERKRIGLREVRAPQPGETIWDNVVRGFGVRRQTDVAAYVLKTRTLEGRQRWITIGRHGAPWTPDSARDQARRLLGESLSSKSSGSSDRRCAASVFNRRTKHQRNAVEVDGRLKSPKSLFQT